MTRLLQIRHLHADLAALDDLLKRLPTTRKIERMGFEMRRDEVAKSIAQLEGRTGRTAETVLLFGGDPVVGSLGIEAPFAAEALDAFQKMVAKDAAAHHGELRSSGPIPREERSRLHITNVVHGSFGFELSEIADEPLIDPTPLALAVDDVNRLIVASGQSDEAFLEAIDGVNGRITDSLTEFLGIIKKHGATMKILHQGGEMEFNQQTISEAAERATLIRKAEEDMPCKGVFLGVLLGSRTFEFRTEEGEEIRGKAEGDLDHLRQLDEWFEKPCVAHLRVVTISRPSKENKRFTLLRLSPV